MESCLKKVTQSQTISSGCIQNSLLKNKHQGKNVNSLMMVHHPMIASKETSEIAGWFRPWECALEEMSSSWEEEEEWSTIQTWSSTKKLQWWVLKDFFFFLNPWVLILKDMRVLCIAPDFLFKSVWAWCAQPAKLDLNKKSLPKQKTIQNFTIDAQGFRKTKN